jgi:hypothetical protein
VNQTQDFWGACHVGCRDIPPSVFVGDLSGILDMLLSSWEELSSVFTSWPQYLHLHTGVTMASALGRDVTQVVKNLPSTRKALSSNPPIPHTQTNKTKTKVSPRLTSIMLTTSQQASLQERG